MRDTGQLIPRGKRLKSGNQYIYLLISKVESAEAVVKEDISFALDEQESDIILDSVISRVKNSVFTDIQQSTDIILITSNNRAGKSEFIEELSKELNSEIRSLYLNSDDLLGTETESDSEKQIDFSLISSIIFESIQLDEHLLISINDADKLPLDTFNELISLALSTNSKKNNVIFLFAGEPDLLTKVEQISNIRRLSIAHSTLDELMLEDLLEFIDLRQTSQPDEQRFRFDDQAIKTIVTHASGSLFKAAVLLEWCREYCIFKQTVEVTAATVSQLLSILLNKSQIDGVNLFGNYPPSGYDFNSDTNISDLQPASMQDEEINYQNRESIPVRTSEEKSDGDKPNVYERVMTDASEVELITNSVPQENGDGNVETSATEQFDTEGHEIEHIVVEDNSKHHRQSTQAKEQAATNKNPDKESAEMKPLHIENTDLSLTRLIPKQSSALHGLSSLQWALIIVITGVIVFYGGIMFVASNGNKTISSKYLSELLPVDALTLSNSEPESALSNTNESASDLPSVSINSPVNDQSVLDKINIKGWVSSFFEKNTDEIQDTETVAISLEPQESKPVRREDSQKENTINALLNLAQTQLNAKKLSSPKSDNAVDTYRMVLQLDPDNEEALSGIESIRVRYLIWAEQQAVAGNSERAKYFLDKAVEVTPNHNY